jgi:hypothetical protein
MMNLAELAGCAPLTPTLSLSLTPTLYPCGVPRSQREREQT